MYRFKIALFFFILSTPLYSYALYNEKTITLISGLPKPPFIMEEENAGMQLDLIKETLSSQGVEVNFLRRPLGRNVMEFQRYNADGIVTLLPDYQHPALHVTKPYITYQNVAVSLSENEFDIAKLSDLSNKSIIAFQNAKKFLGEKFNEIVNYSMDYREFHDQSKQIEMLFLRRTEVVILDINIFKHFIKHSENSIYNKPFNVHYIFNERPYSAGFRAKEIRDIFDRGIQQMKEDGSYQLIIDNYLQ